MKKPYSEEAIALAASGWVVRESRGLTPVEQDEQSAWLAADPLHGVWLARRRKEWTEFDLLSEWRPEHSAEPNPDLLAASRPKHRSRWKGWSMGLMAASIVVGCVLAWQSRQAPAAEFSSGVYESRTLADGSVVDLQTGARIEVRFVPGERRVRLIQGEAQFRVARNPSRPFVVEANGVAVNAVGTAFDVTLGSRSIEVSVMEGQVRVDPPVGSGVAAHAVALGAGQKLVANFQGDWTPHVAALFADEMARRLHWSPPLLDFNSSPLADVVAEFNRRNRVQLVLADPGLQQMPIVASFSADNVEGFVRMLELSSGVHASRRGDVIELRLAR